MDNNNSSNTSPTIDDDNSSNTPQTKDRRKLNPWLRAIIIGTGSIVIVFAIVMIGNYLLNELNRPKCDCASGFYGNDLTENLDPVNFGFLQLESDIRNIIYSPLSIRYGLSVLGAGAEGETKNEINRLLTSTKLPNPQNIPGKLSFANAMFIRDSFKNSVFPEYIQTVKDCFGGEVLFDSFTSSSNMDDWTKQKTFNLIDKIGVTPTTDTRLVLTNALAIQMDWKEQFDTYATGGDLFHLADGTDITATTMHQETYSNFIKYYVDDLTTIISMPLDTTDENQALEFVAIMPTEDLSKYIEDLENNKTHWDFTKMTPVNTQKGLLISIPKFKFDYELEFIGDLKALGVKAAFDEQSADFSNITNNPLYVSNASHRASIEFSENGIEAAASTAFGIAANSAEEDASQPDTISIDRPFLFLIRDPENETIWFVGAVYQPDLWQDSEIDNLN